DNGGLLLSETDAKQQQTTATYDALGRIRTQTAGGQTTSFYYDEAGYGASVRRLTPGGYPRGGQSLVYPARGQVISTTKTIGSVSQTLTSSYDTLGRLSTLTYPDKEVVSYGYGADGRLQSVSGYVSAMSFGPNGELQSLTYANGTRATYSYDPNR